MGAASLTPSWCDDVGLWPVVSSFHVQVFLYQQHPPRGGWATVLKTVSFPTRSRWRLLASSEPGGVRGGR